MPPSPPRSAPPCSAVGRIVASPRYVPIPSDGDAAGRTPSDRTPASRNSGKRSAYRAVALGGGVHRPPSTPRRPWSRSARGSPSMKSATRLHALIAMLAVAHRHLPVLLLAIAHHQHVRDLLQLRVADLEVHLLAAVVHGDADAGGVELLAAPVCAYSVCRSVIGSTIACTGASHTGNAPA